MNKAKYSFQYFAGEHRLVGLLSRSYTIEHREERSMEASMEAALGVLVKLEEEDLCFISR